MNQNQSFKAIQIPYELYEEWCKEKEKNPSLPKTKEEFFRLILDGKLVREGNKLIRKRIRENEKK